MINFDKFTSGTVVEIITGNYAYVAEFEKVENDRVMVTNAFIINIIPYQTPEGQFQQVPRLDPRNIYSSGTLWSFKIDDVVYCDEIQGSRFVAMYKDAVSGYLAVKSKEGSGIDIVQEMPKSFDPSTLGPLQ